MAFLNRSLYFLEALRKLNLRSAFSVSLSVCRWKQRSMKSLDDVGLLAAFNPLQLNWYLRSNQYAHRLSEGRFMWFKPMICLPMWYILELVWCHIISPGSAACNLPVFDLWHIRNTHHRTNCCNSHVLKSSWHHCSVPLSGCIWKDHIRFSLICELLALAIQPCKCHDQWMLNLSLVRQADEVHPNWC